jgi:hypothetical protein
LSFHPSVLLVPLYLIAETIRNVQKPSTSPSSRMV